MSHEFRSNFVAEQLRILMVRYNKALEEAAGTIVIGWDGNLFRTTTEVIVKEWEQELATEKKEWEEELQGWEHAWEQKLADELDRGVAIGLEQAAEVRRDGVHVVRSAVHVEDTEVRIHQLIDEAIRLHRENDPHIYPDGSRQ